MSEYFDILNVSGIKVLASPGSGFPLAVLTGNAGQALQDNFLQIAERTGNVHSTSGAPSVNNDEADTAALGTSFTQWSKWHDTYNDLYYACLDSTPTAAVWSNLSSAGGGLSNVIEDTSPQLGASLDVNGNSIVSISDGDIDLTPNGTGQIVLDNLRWPDSQTPTAGDVLTYQGTAELLFVAPKMKNIELPMSQANPAEIGALAALPVYRNGHLTLEFTDAVIDEINFEAVLPDSYAGSGLEFELHWVSDATSGNGYWQIQIERMTTDLDADSFATAQDIISATNGTAGIITKSSITADDGGDMDSAAAGDAIRIKVLRNGSHASDTLSDVAQLVRLVMKEQ